MGQKMYAEVKRGTFSKLSYCYNTLNIMLKRTEVWEQPLKDQISPWLSIYPLLPLPESDGK